MRMAELARASGVPVATIKYYLREGLLHPGESTAPNQARYDESHVHRLELVRALREGAGLPLSAIARSLTAMDEHRARHRPEYLSAAIAALSDPVSPDEAASASFVEAERFTNEAMEALGWDVDATSPGRSDLVRAVASVHQYMPGLLRDPRHLRPFADAARTLAAIEIPESYDPDADREGVLRFSVLGTVLFERVITSLRKLAHVDRIRTVTAGTGDDGTG